MSLSVALKDGAMDDLIKEYDKWIKDNIPQWYIDRGCTDADYILFESLDGGCLDLNDAEVKWLKDFIKRWDKQLKERKTQC